tara:strand:+ start:3891 stop:4655 length:765 start_codon:yes stop_codon:yes gene_type:complete
MKKTNNNLFLERMRSPDIAAAIAEGTSTVIVPCGAVEQHGPHLPMFTDAEHGTHLGAEVAERLGNALVAPTIRVGCSEHHMTFAGTISLREETFRAVCNDYCKSLSRHGFTKICMLPTHGGNFKPLENMLEKLKDTAEDGCTVVAFTDLIALVETWKEAVEETSGLGDRVGGHADIAESSLMLHLHPELVKEDDAQQGFTAELDETAIQKIINNGFHTVTPNGILGDARGMSKKIGRDCLSAVADLIANYFREG